MKIELKDENGKLVSVDLNKSIFYLTDDMESESNACFASIDTIQNADRIDTKIFNADGTDFSIADSDDKSDDITDIDVYIEASHSDTKINSGFYSGDSMLRDAETYILPFGKPIIKNHDSHSEPLGRIIESQCTDSSFLNGVKTIDVKANITDRDAMTKFMDGRYKTVSIGANPKTIVCNHCGKHILKDSKFNFCGHWRGETYNEKECTWKLEDLEYTELSVVNKPADRNAQVYKIVVHRKSDKVQNNDDSEKLIIDELSNEILNHNETELDDGNNINDETQDIVESTIIATDKTCTDEVINDDEESKTLVEILNEKIDNLSLMISNLQNENNNLRDNSIIISIDNDTMSSKIEALTSNIKTISDMYKRDLALALNIENTDEMTFTELKTNFDDFIKNNNKNSVDVNNEEEESNKVVKPATNPGLVNNDNDKVIKEDDNTEPIRVTTTYSLDSVVSSLIR